MSHPFANTDPLSVACPRCGAAAWAPCDRGLNPWRRGLIHALRVYYARGNVSKSMRIPKPKRSDK